MYRNCLFPLSVLLLVLLSACYEWKEGFQPWQKRGLIWYTDGSKTNKGTGAGVYCYGTGRKLSFSLGQYTTVFQAEVYAIKACSVENLDRNYKNGNMYILSIKQQLNHLANTRSPQNWSGTATNPSHNWPDIMGFNWYGCQGMRVLL
jgi:hypothetical protein